ncbi:malonyl-ACP O-methyltransferase BioC [Effusibacillus pohliae]|uniref:malonyl-ACP O-methyltransferase BioC n=1 Tax=Effusibacillus pohliae TaxID=232270 RepID=UPI000361A76F|nr:malonyl-ACP O-methyltransferase BioC [Effusibacillus pohliae]
METAKIDKQLLQKRFSQNAKTYDRYANVQKIMAQTLLELAFESCRAKVESASRLHILEIGCGTGFLTSRLQQCFPNALITAVDLAPGMIEVARTRVAGDSVRFLVGDIEEMPLTGTYDLIISNATFQWFNQLPATVQRLFHALNRQGVLLFSTFGNRTFQELHASFQLAQAKQGVSNRHTLGQPFYSLPELRRVVTDALNRAEYRIDCFERTEMERFDSVRDFLTSVKKIGANNSTAGDYCIRPRLIQDMLAIYEQRYRDGRSVVATYHTLFVQIAKIGPAATPT